MGHGKPRIDVKKFRSKNQEKLIIRFLRLALQPLPVAYLLKTLINNSKEMQRQVDSTLEFEFPFSALPDAPNKSLINQFKNRLSFC